MKIGMFTSGYQYYPLEKAFQDAKRIGYDYIELWGGRPHAFAFDVIKYQAKDICSLISKYNLPVEIYTPEHNAYPYNYMIGDIVQRADSIEYIKTAICAAKNIGAEKVLISTGHAGLINETQKETILYDSLSEICEFAEKNDIVILLEALTHFETNVCTKASDLYNIINKINSPYLYGMCDTVVPFIEGEPVINYFRLLKDKCAHVHFVDCDGSSETHVVPGLGIMPLPEILEDIRNYEYDGTMTIELVTAYINEPYAYAKKAYDYVKKIL